ncbi:MAG TPA: 30S ribosomal protein S16 [Candidatus Hypogeohydataceae bacterium YC41]
MVRIRLKRMGRKNRPFYRIAIMDAREERDGKTIEEVGWYDPLASDNSKREFVKKERIEYWLSVGAKPSESAAAILKRQGISFKP